ncbi:recombinase RecB [Lusitaniella coriacea LEGE 07157]|uniref:Recombinase RecB n=1 Tax=Lusitaniella coriacea LEGE 07157 TaxID=945747 RepID=A0A8J7J6B0_9CYAN|nr:recombinase RecB [Lusitaniella coriacea]MBE9118579.1 recombinase RecB [Lusitaniella coriacea LEGE 07157]
MDDLKNSAALRKIAEGWQFIGESALEDFCWNNLDTLFGFAPLERQLTIKGETCDLLALNQKQLIIIELKNVEDRYIVQQLTRYYDNLIDFTPFDDKINYDLPIRLIAIAPIFHRHNFIDRKYSKLDLEFITFSILHVKHRFYLNLKNTITDEPIKKIEINYREINFKNTGRKEIPSPPKKLIDWLGALTVEEVSNLLKIRNKILEFDRRIEEIVDKTSIIYGSKYRKDKVKPCAEFCFDIRAKKVLIFLWLKVPLRKHKTVTRMQVQTKYEYKYWMRYIKVKQGKLSCKKMETIHLKGYPSYFSSKNLDNGFLRKEIVIDPMEDLVQEALTIWQERV